MAMYDGLMLAPITIGCLALGLLVVISLRFLGVSRDPQEPPFVHALFPLVGHVVPFFREGADYFTRIYKKHGYDIFTINIFSMKFYVLATPEWTQAMHRQHKSLSLNTLISQATKHVFGMDEQTMRIIEHNANGEDGTRTGVLLESHDIIFDAFLKSVRELNVNFLESWTPHINSLAGQNSPQTMQLWYWLRHHFSIASTTAIWGPRNPLASTPSLEQDVWVFDDHIDKFFSMPWPSMTIPKGYRARQRLIDAFIKYVAEDGHAQAAHVLRARADVNYKYGISPKMVGVSETSILFAVLINTVPVTFWLLSFVLADPSLLSDVRAEVEQCISVSSNTCTLDVSQLLTQCPLLNSAMRETLRLTAPMNINRYVNEDTVLNNTATGESRLVKKGALVVVGSTIMHFEPTVYGDEPHKFNARRFLPTVEKTQHGDKVLDPAAGYRDADGKLHSGAFRSFGGGNNVCPGRFFAQAEILTVVALLVVGFDIVAASGGVYVPPPFQATKMIAGVVSPNGDVEVRIKRRPGYESVQWACVM